ILRAWRHGQARVAFRSGWARWSLGARQACRTLNALLALWSLLSLQPLRTYSTVRSLRPLRSRGSLHSLGSGRSGRPDDAPVHWGFRHTADAIYADDSRRAVRHLTGMDGVWIRIVSMGVCDSRGPEDPEPHEDRGTYRPPQRVFHASASRLLRSTN